ILNTINPQLVRFTLIPGTGTIVGAPPSTGTQSLQGYQDVQNTLDKINAAPAGTSAFTADQCASAQSNLVSYQNQLTDYCTPNCGTREKTGTDQYKNIQAEIRNYQS